MQNPTIIEKYENYRQEKITDDRKIKLTGGINRMARTRGLGCRGIQLAKGSKSVLRLQGCRFV